MRALRTPHWAVGLALGLLSAPAAAQVPTGWALKATPQHLILSGYWLEAEHVRADHPRQTFTLGPQLYWGRTGHPNVAATPFDQNRDGAVRGGGLQVQHRFYLLKNADHQGHTTGPYVGYAPQVQVFRLGFSRVEWHEETGPGNLPYVLYGPVRYHETVLRYGASAQAGWQWLLGRRVLLDVYTGLGLRQSHSWSDVGTSQFNSGSSDYAHRGLYVPAGFKLGVAL